MFGHEWLVAPVVELGQRKRRVFFPAGPQCNEWKHWETGEVYTGGQTTEVAVPFDSPAAFKCATQR